MIRIINCVGGYGDILFCEPIFRHFWKLDGKKPIVVIHSHQMWIKDYIESAEFSNNPYEAFLTGSLVHNEGFINLRYANQILRGYGPDDHHDLENMMLDKYRLLWLHDDMWKRLDIKLDLKIPESKGVNLAVACGVSPATKFTLINEDSQAGSIKIPTDNMYFRLWCKMFQRPGFTLIDWWYMIWSAKENHHVSTSTFFLMQAIKNKYPEWNAPCYIYPRPNIDGLRGISQLKPDFNLIRIEK